MMRWAWFRVDDDGECIVVVCVCVCMKMLVVGKCLL